MTAYSDQEAEAIRQQLENVAVNGVRVFDGVTLTSNVYHEILCSSPVGVSVVTLRRKPQWEQEEQQS